MRDAVGLRDDERQVRALARALARERIAPLAAQVDETEAYPGEQLRLLAQVEKAPCIGQHGRMPPRVVQARKTLGSRPRATLAKQAQQRQQGLDASVERLHCTGFRLLRNRLPEGGRVPFGRPCGGTHAGTVTQRPRP